MNHSPPRASSRRSLRELLGDLAGGSHAALPPGDIRQLVADTLALLGAVAVTLYVLTLLFFPVVNWGTRLASGVLAFLPFLMRPLVMRIDSAWFASITLLVLMLMGTVWVVAARTVHSAHLSFFMLPLLFVSFMYGARAALGAMLATGVLLAALAWLNPMPGVNRSAEAQAWLQFQFCALVSVCALMLRRYVARSHQQALQARLASARDAEQAHLGGRLSLTLQAAQASAWEYDGSTGLVSVDGRLNHLLGDDLGQGLRPPGRMRDKLVGDSVARYDAVIARLLQSDPEDTRFDIALEAAHNGRAVHMQLICQVERDAAGRALRAFGLVLDETERALERVKVQDALVQAQREAEQANRAKTSFLANVSHDIRTPMSAVIGLSTLAQQAPDLPQALAHMRRAETAATSLLALLDDVLDFSRIEAGKLPLLTSRFEVHGLVSTLKDTLGVVAAAKGLQLDLVVDADVPTNWVADRLRLQQVLQNLLSNAVKFTQQGHVRLLVQPTPGDAGETGLRFEVSDSGVGLDAETLARVFQPFEQGHADTAQRQGGSGLGLAIARELVELMGGRLHAESTRGEGSRFSFVLPALPEPAIASAMPSAAEPRAGARVLLVEDSEDLQIIGMAMLRSLGLQAVLAGDALTALRILATEPMDAVLMDIQLPGMDGLQATQRIREAEPPHRRLPVIALTAHALESEAAASLAAGMDDHLSKPVELARLRSTLARWLPAESPGPAAAGEVMPSQAMPSQAAASIEPAGSVQAG